MPVNKPLQTQSNTQKIAFYAKEVLEREPLFTIDIDIVQSQLPDLLVSTKEIISNYSYDITFLSLEDIRELNRTTRETDSATDVLSFEPVGEFTTGDLEVTAEIFICPQYIASSLSEALQAPDSQQYNEELVRMTVHGILHVNGYNHEGEFGYDALGRQDLDLEPMYILQEKLVKALSY